jgi:hypothetical protein
MREKEEDSHESVAQSEIPRNVANSAPTKRAIFSRNRALAREASGKGGLVVSSKNAELFSNSRTEVRKSNTLAQVIILTVVAACVGVVSSPINAHSRSNDKPSFVQI